jgi:glucosamine--fructose-6-phosphate aminotransferase (isomerizing)
MCGIVGAAARREVSDILLEGLRRLEYRGYDSAGLALVDNEANLLLHKQQGKVAALERIQRQQPILGCTGIAHTRWATHGEPSQVNAHPHTAGNRLALVHNGIIENHTALRAELVAAGREPVSATDSELVALMLEAELRTGAQLLEAMQKVVPRLDGAFALAAIDSSHPDQVVAARRGSPLVIGVGIGENFLASDQLALRQVTDSFIYLQDGDLALLTPTRIELIDESGGALERPVASLSDTVETADRDGHSHYMYKEIFEQPRVIADTLATALPAAGELDLAALDAAFGEGAAEVFAKVRGVQIVACGTSYHAGLVARHWLEELAGIPCQVEVASEFRYRKRVQHRDSLLVTVSQSGETADTLAALRNVADGEFAATLAIINTVNSALERESQLVFHTRAGIEVGVASTKAFTTQLVAFLLLTMALGRHHRLDAPRCTELAGILRRLPVLVEETLASDKAISQVSEEFVGRFNALFLGRGIHSPIAMEGALKLKEISYIHAESYPAGELKHGPLALVDREMPVVAVAPSNELLEKLKSNLEEVRARGGELYVFADEAAGFSNSSQVTVVPVPHGPELVMPFIYTVALQLLAYHVAVMKGTDVDQPRNLAKSVTVE